VNHPSEKGQATRKRDGREGQKELGKTDIVSRNQLNRPLIVGKLEEQKKNWESHPRKKC